MNTISVQLPPLLLAFFFSSTIVGFYALGHRLLSMPMSLIGSSIAQVFFQRAAEAKNQGALHSVVRNTFIRLVALGAFPLILIMIGGKDFFSVIFGSQWAEAGIYAQILAPWILFVFLGSPLSTLFSIMEMQGTGLFFNFILLATRVASLIAGGFTGSILLALLLYAATGTIMWGGLCLYLLNKSGLTVRLWYRDVCKVVINAAISLMPVIFLKFYGTQSLFIVIAGCLSALLYYALIYFHDEELRKLFARWTGRLD